MERQTGISISDQVSLAQQSIRGTGITRRSTILGPLAGAALAMYPTRSSGQSFADLPPHPDPRLFETGDFLWPKKPDEYVPFNTEQEMTESEERAKWEKEKDTYLRKHGSRAPSRGSRAAARLSEMSFEDFHSLFTEDLPASTQRPYSYGSIGFGHAAIVEKDSQGKLWVIEAMPKSYKFLLGATSNGVIRVPYENWKNARANQKIWHGRIAEIGLSQRANIAKQARAFEGQPYDFWNFDLEDPSGFYCTKLCWLSILKGVHIAIDGVRDSDRDFWFTPKQLLKLDRIRKLHSPGPF